MMTTNAYGACPWCNGWHTGRCPLVHAIEYFENGLIKRVEFFDHSVWRTAPVATQVTDYIPPPTT